MEFSEPSSLLNTLSIREYHITPPGKHVQVLGEWHDIRFESCPLPHIRLADYVTDFAVRTGANVLLEITPPDVDDLRNIHSFNIRETVHNLLQHGLRDRIIPFDYRPWFLPHERIHRLYAENLRGVTLQKIQQEYIEPFFVKAREGAFNLNPELYTQKTLEYLYEQYIPQMDVDFRQVAQTGNVHELKNAWAKVTDFYLLREVLQNNRNPLIILVGESHAQHLATVLPGLVSERLYSDGDCIQV